MGLKNTEKMLIDAVSKIIENEGFPMIRINNVAKTAGCDKVLIYRYFGNLNGLITEWAKHNDFYAKANEMFIDKIATIDKTSLKEFVKEILLSQLHFIRDNKVYQELMLWELSGDMKFKAIRELREESGHRLQTTLNEIYGVKDGKADMYVTMLIASINYTVLSTAKYTMFNGIDFSKEKSWMDFRQALCDYVDKIFELI